MRKQLLELNRNTRTDGSRKTVYQQTALADIELEKFMFMKVSEILNGIKIEDVPRISAVIVENVKLSEGSNEELSIIQRELEQAAKESGRKDKDTYLKLKATVDRAHRFSTQFSEGAIHAFQSNV